MSEGDVIVTLTMAEELIHADDGTIEPVSLLVQKTWCQECGWSHLDIAAKALDMRAHHAGPRESPGTNGARMKG